MPYLKHTFHSSAGKNCTSPLFKLNGQSRNHEHLKIKMALTAKTNKTKHL